MSVLATLLLTFAYTVLPLDEAMADWRQVCSLLTQSGLVKGSIALRGGLKSREEV